MNFRSKHNLQFLSRPWMDGKMGDYQEYKIGTCHGQWFAKPGLCYVIVSIINEQPGNGHLEDVFEWFEASCKRDKMQLVITEFFNDRFKVHCIEKRGFMPAPFCNGVMKIFI